VAVAADALASASMASIGRVAAHGELASAAGGLANADGGADHGVVDPGDAAAAALQVMGVLVGEHGAGRGLVEWAQCGGEEHLPTRRQRPCPVPCHQALGGLTAVDRHRADVDAVGAEHRVAQRGGNGLTALRSKGRRGERGEAPNTLGSG